MITTEKHGRKKGKGKEKDKKSKEKGKDMLLIGGFVDLGQSHAPENARKHRRRTCFGEGIH